MVEHALDQVMSLRSKLAVGALLALVALLLELRSRLRALQLEMHALSTSVKLLTQGSTATHASSTASAQGSEASELTVEADRLYSEQKLDGALALLSQHGQGADVEVLWRTSRVQHDRAGPREGHVED